MSFAGLVLAVVAAVPQWLEEPRIEDAQAASDENYVTVDVGKSVARGRLNVQIREIDGRFVHGDTVRVYNGRAGLGFKPGSVGPWLVTLNLVGDNGRFSPDRRLAADVDWVPRCEGESPWHPCHRPVFLCGNDSRFARALLLGGNPVAGDPLWLRVRRAPPDIGRLLAAAALEANGIPLRVAADEDDGAGTHYLLLAPDHPLPAGQALQIPVGMPGRAIFKEMEIRGQGGLIVKAAQSPPEWSGDIETRRGSAASLQLNLHERGAALARIRIEYPGRAGGARSILIERDEGVFTVGCVACRDRLELPEDTDAILTVQLVGAGRESAPRRIQVRTPLRTDGRNGRRPTAWETAARVPDPPQQQPPAPPPAPPSAPARWPLRVLLFGILPFLAGYSLESLRRKMSSPSAPISARRKPKRRKSDIG